MGRSEGKGSCYAIKIPLTNEKWIDDKLNPHFVDGHNLTNACIAEALKRLDFLRGDELFKPFFEVREIEKLLKKWYKGKLKGYTSERIKVLKARQLELEPIEKQNKGKCKKVLKEFGISGNRDDVQTNLVLPIRNSLLSENKIGWVNSVTYSTISDNLSNCFKSYINDTYIFSKSEDKKKNIGKGEIHFKSRKKGDYFSVVNGTRNKKGGYYNGPGLYIDIITNKFFVLSKLGSDNTYKIPIHLTPDDAYILKNLSRAFDMDYVPETKEQLKSFMVELKEKCIANGWQKKEGVCVLFDSIRFCGLQQEYIRGKRRYNLLLTFDGTPLNKYETCLEDAPTNVCGIDIGPRTVVCTYRDKDGIVFATEVHELVPEIDNDYMRKMADVNRSMESKRRYNNPQNYNEDGTISKGKKEWIYSNSYLVKRVQYNALNRSKTETTEMRQGELIKHILSMAHNIVIEDMDWNVLAKNNFGKSILIKSPGGFMTRLESEVKSVGGTFTRAAKYDTRASQYNHQTDEYIKKSQSDRTARGLKLNGIDISIQRDLYSSFLLANMDIETKKIDKSMCDKGFDSFILCHNITMGELRKAFDKNELSDALKNILDLRQLKQF